MSKQYTEAEIAEFLSEMLPQIDSDDDPARAFIAIIRQLQAELAEARKDAKRWNYVMLNERYSSSLWHAMPWDLYSVHRHLNSAIDDAILASRSKT